MSYDKVELKTRVNRDIRELFLLSARAHGLDPSEYLRKIVLDELDRHGLIGTRINDLAERLTHTIVSPPEG